MFGRLIGQDKNRSSERELVLKVMEGKKAISTAGATDNRIFTGELKVYAVMDPATTHWSIKYSNGNPPPVLKKSYTKFVDLYAYVKRYFNGRNIEIVEVKD